MSKLNKLNILVAYPYFSKGVYDFLAKQDPSSFRLIVDSGAFTAWNTGKHIDLQAYCKFLKTIPFEWETKIVQLDVYGNPKQTYKNYLTMLDMGYKDVMPVFTRGDTIERLEEFYTYTDYIMFGGIAIGGKNRNYVKWFCDVNKGRKAHWLGFVNTPFIKHFKPYSVDSSSATATSRYGQLYFYVGNGDLKTIHRRKFNARPPTIVIDSLLRIGFTANEIMQLRESSAWEGGSIKPHNNAKGLAGFMGLVSHLKRSFDVENAINTKIYLAMGNINQLQSLYSALQFLKERKVIQ